MQEHLQELAAKYGKSLAEVHKMLKQARKEASKRKLRVGTPQHTQHSWVNLYNMLEAGKPAEKEQPKKMKKD